VRTFVNPQRVFRVIRASLFRHSRRAVIDLGSVTSSVDPTMSNRHRNLWRDLAAISLALTVVGCVSFEPAGYGTHQASDPPYLSPYQRPLTGPTPQLPPGQSPGELVPTPSFKPPELEAPLESEPLPGPNDSEVIPLEEFEGPSIVPFGTTPTPAPTIALELSVDVEERHKTGEPVKFTVKIRNAGAQAVANVAISAEFDETLVFPGREEKMVRQSLGTIAAGATRELPLTLVGQSTGRCCTEFLLTADDKELASKSVCVELSE
jgi:hypothetical protein